MDDIQELLEKMRWEEKTIQFSIFTNETAWQLGNKLQETAKREEKSVTIDICRNGQQLFHYASPGTSADNDEWIIRKNRVVNRFGHSSYYMGNYFKSLETTISKKSLLDEHDYAPHGGSFPLIIKDVGVVGTITVSGLPQKEDHEFVIRVLKEFLNII